MSCPHWLLVAIPAAFVACIVAAASGQYQRHLAWKAQQAEDEAQRIQKLDVVRKRFAAALQHDADTQKWVTASPNCRVEDLTAPVLAQPEPSSSGAERRPEGTKLPPSTPFPNCHQPAECGSTMTVSFRANVSSTNWGPVTCNAALQPVGPSSTSAATDDETAFTAMHASQGAELRAIDEEDMPFEVEDSALRQFQRFAHRAKADRVPQWTVSDLQKTRPIPKVYLDL